MRVLNVVFIMVCVGLIGCSSGTPTTGTTSGTETASGSAPAAAPAAKPYANLAQLMRGIPFPNSNLIFDTQSNDPGATKKETAGVEGAGATSTYASVYTGWERVEYAALALSEVANLIMIPGRVCSNGKPVPIDRDDFKKAAQGLADAGMAAYKAAQSKSQDAMVDVSGTVADACAACHEIYRDKGPAGSPERCAVPTP